MKFGRLIGILIVTFAVGITTLWSQSAGQITKDAQAIAILQRTSAVLARGPVKTPYILTGQVLDPGTDEQIGTFILQVRGSDFKFESVKNGVARDYAVIAGRAFSRTQGKAKSIPDYNAVDLSPDIIPNFSHWTRFAEGATEVMSQGTSTEDGQELVSIRVRPERGSSHKNRHLEQTILINPQTFEIRELRYEGTQGTVSGSEIEVANVYSDYENFGALRVPTTIKRRLAGKIVAVLKVQNVQAGAALDSDFQ